MHTLLYTYYNFLCVLIFIVFLGTLCNRGKIMMEKLKIEKNTKSNDTITRTIRISGKTFDKIMELAEKNDLSFNNVINQVIEYALNHVED